MILFNKYMSPTSDKDIALKFAKSILFEIEIMNESSLGMYEIENYYIFPNGKEFSYLQSIIKL